MTTYSYSRIDRYLTCPLSYKLEYVDKMPGEKAAPLLLGGVCHDFFEAYDRHLLQTKQESDHAAAEQIMVDVFARFERPLKATIFEEYMDICHEHVADHVLNLKTVVGIEEQIALDQDMKPCGWDAPETWLRCKLDRLDMEGDVAIITDYKTGWGGKADRFQLEIYAMAVCAQYPFINRIEIVLSYTRSGYEDRTIFKRDRIERTEKLVRAYIKQIESDTTYEPTPGRGCTTCPYGHRCSARASDLLTIQKPADALQIAKDILVMDAQYKQKQEALKEWCESRGKVEINGVEFGHNLREYYKVLDPESFLKTIQEAKLDPNEFYKLDTTGLKKKCSKDPALAQVLANVIEVETKTIFGQRQGEKPERKMPKAAKPKKPTTRAAKGKRTSSAPYKQGGASERKQSRSRQAPLTGQRGQESQSPDAAAGGPGILHSQERSV